MPDDWTTYSRLYYVGDVTVVTPDLHDVAVSKTVAGRDKDAAWIAGLLRHGMIDLPRLLERIAALDPASYAVESLQAWARRRADEAGIAS